MSQYKIETLYTKKGSCTYYVEADNADEAVKLFETPAVQNNQVDERMFGMEEEITSVDAILENETVDVKAMQEVQKEEWAKRMGIILKKNGDNLRETMGFGVPDEQKLKS
tara:strand:+ start:105 stop:434 length:330 start_codon:yes stop_codon:yes gene_type:complete